MVNDRIADLLTRIRNAGERKTQFISAPVNKASVAICTILKENDYIEAFEVAEDELKIELKYLDKKHAIRHIQKLSKPGLRKYVGYKDIPRILNGLGLCILSTSKGVMSGKKAKLEKVGGELICEIW